MAASEALNAIFVGGMAESNNFKPTGNKEASIFRMDLEQNSWVWRKAFTCISCDLEVITSLAVSGDNTKVAAAGTLYDT